jgi:hypothetical protein
LEDSGNRSKKRIREQLTDWAVALVFELFHDAAGSIVLARRRVAGFELGVAVLTCPAGVTDTPETNRKRQSEKSINQAINI